MRQTRPPSMLKADLLTACAWLTFGVALMLLVAFCSGCSGGPSAPSPTPGAPPTPQPICRTVNHPATTKLDPLTGRIIIVPGWSEVVCE